MHVSYSARVRDLCAPMAMAIADKVRNLRANGVNVVSFTQGEPDFDTPSHIGDAAIQALCAHDTHYTSSRGYVELRNAIASHYNNRYGVIWNPDCEVIVTPGAKHAIYSAIQALVGIGDEVLLIEPCWMSYADMVKMAGGIPIAISTNVNDGFVPSIAALEKRLSRRTRMIILNNPGNPTGNVWSFKQLEQLSKWVLKNNLLVLSDEIYDRIVYDPHKFYSFASLPGMREKTITVNGFSKSYAMTGWRIGYVLAAEHLIPPILLVHENIATCTSSFVQRAAIAALNGAQDSIAKMINEYSKRRALVSKEVSSIPGLRLFVPQGTFYAFIQVPGDDLAFADDLLKSGVAVVPGSAYGQSGCGWIRLSFACSEASILAGFETIREFMRLRK